MKNLPVSPSPSSLDAVVFGHLAPLLNAKLPNAKLQQQLKSLDNLTLFCSNILLLYFPGDGRGERCLRTSRNAFLQILNNYSPKR
jgi:hypothetical protein